MMCSEKPASLRRLAPRLLALGANVDARRLVSDNNVRRPHFFTQDGATALSTAALNGDEEMTRLLIKHRANPSIRDKVGQTPLHRAASAGATSVVRELVKAYPEITDVTANSAMTALTLAVWREHVETVRVLLDAGASPNAADAGFTPLMQACRMRAVELVRLLLRAGADANDGGQMSMPPLTIAAQSGSLDIVRLLLDAHANPNGADKVSWSALALVSSS